MTLTQKSAKKFRVTQRVWREPYSELSCQIEKVTLGSKMGPKLKQRNNSEEKKLKKKNCEEKWTWEAHCEMRGVRQNGYLSGNQERTSEVSADHRSAGRTTSDNTKIGTG